MDKINTAQLDQNIPLFMLEYSSSTVMSEKEQLVDEGLGWRLLLCDRVSNYSPCGKIIQKKKRQKLSSNPKQLKNFSIVLRSHSKAGSSVLSSPYNL